jgi:hypothetical protein
MNGDVVSPSHVMTAAIEPLRLKGQPIALASSRNTCLLLGDVGFEVGNTVASDSALGRKSPFAP